jgi:hypothetical protein
VPNCATASDHGFDSESAEYKAPFDTTSPAIHLADVVDPKMIAPPPEFSLAITSLK